MTIKLRMLDSSSSTRTFLAMQIPHSAAMRGSFVNKTQTSFRFGGGLRPPAGSVVRGVPLGQNRPELSGQVLLVHCEAPLAVCLGKVHRVDGVWLETQNAAPRLGGPGLPVGARQGVDSKQRLAHASVIDAVEGGGPLGGAGAVLTDGEMGVPGLRNEKVPAVRLVVVGDGLLGGRTVGGIAEPVDLPIGVFPGGGEKLGGPGNLRNAVAVDVGGLEVQE